jgi:hypothetical protein
MAKYLFLYRTPESPSNQQPSPEEMQGMLAQWDAWKIKFARQVIDVGDGLKPEGRVWRAGAVSDGPFVETKEVMGGYSIIQASGFDEATAVAKACPITFIPGASIEIRELAGY